MESQDITIQCSQDITYNIVIGMQLDFKKNIQDSELPK